MSPLAAAIRSILSTSAQQPISDERGEHLRFLRLVLDFCYAHLGQLRGNFGNPVDRIAIPLYCTLVQLGDAIHTVSSAGPSVAVPSLARQALDAYVDLFNVLTHEDYWKSLELADHRNWNRALQVASVGKNPYYKAIAESGQLLEEGRKNHADRLATWASTSVPRYEAKDRFALAGMADEYETLWQMLSAYLHNNLSAVYSRHYEIREDGPPRHVLISPDRIPYELAGMSHVGELLIVTSEMIHAHCGKKMLDTVNLRRELAEHNRLQSEEH